jgi:hypothetical protein
MTGRWFAVVVMTVAAVGAAAQTSGPRFHADDPLLREPETQDASAAEEREIGLFYELAYNLAVAARHTPSNTRAGNVNTIDEVPDSSWFTNRIGTIAVSDTDIAQGPIIGRPPSPERW